MPSALTGLISLLTAACTSDGESSNEPDASANPSHAPTDQGDTSRANRRPQAVVLFSGRIAYPHLAVTTWSTCPSVGIERVVRVNEAPWA